MAETTTSFLEYQQRAAPSWLQKPWGRAWNGAFGALKDIVRAGFVYAVKTWTISSSPPDHLAAHGWDRDLERYPGESVEGYRTRLLGAFDSYAWTGTDKGVVDELAAAGFTAVVIRDRGKVWIPDATEDLGGRFIGLGQSFPTTTAFTHDSRSPAGFHTLPTGAIWARMWVVVDLRGLGLLTFDSYTEIASSFSTYAEWASYGLAWGCTLSLSTCALIRRIVGKWVQSGVLVEEIAVVIKGELFGFAGVEAPEGLDYSDLSIDRYSSVVLKLEGW